MAKYIVGYNLPGCIPDEPPFEHDSFEDAKKDLLWHIENYIETLEESSKHLFKDEIKRYEDLRYQINEFYNEDDVPLAVRVGMNNVWIEAAPLYAEEHAG